MKIPQNIITDVIADIQNEAEGLSHGIITLQLHCRDSHVHLYRVNRERSVVTSPHKKAEGSPSNSLQSKELKNTRLKNEQRV